MTGHSNPCCYLEKGTDILPHPLLPGSHSPAGLLMLEAGPLTQAATATGSIGHSKQQTTASQPGLQPLLLGVKRHFLE